MSEAKDVIAASIEHLPHLCSRKVTGEFLGHQPEYVSRLIAAGELVAVKRIGGKTRHVKIPRESIRRYLERCVK